MKAIRRGTKLFETVLNTAINIRCFSLENSFIGHEMREDNPNLVIPPRAWLRKELERFNFAKLQQHGDGTYVLYVHSNLWYEFRTE